MNVNVKEALKKIGFFAAYLPFLAVTGFFLYVLHSSNRYFFAYPASSAAFTANQLEQITSVFIAVSVVLIVILTVLSFTLRQKKKANKLLLWACGIFSVLCMIFFMVLCHLDGLFMVAFENVNLYLLYFFMAAFSTALVLFSAIRNLVKIKRSPVTFAKSEAKIMKPETESVQE